jgi:site-specific recombinase XerD
MSNPHPNGSSPSPKRHRRRLPKTITEAEFHRLIAATGNSRTGRRNRAAFWLMYGSGLRVGEVVALAPRDVRWTGPGAPSLRVRLGKGSRDRVVAIPAAAYDALEAWVTVRPKSRWLISTLAGGQISTRYLLAALARYSERAGVYLPDDANGQRPVWPHALRHSFATRLLDEGVNVAQVQQLLGHSDLSTTAVYLGVNPERTLDEARAAFDGPGDEDDPVAALIRRIEQLERRLAAGVS